MKKLLAVFVLAAIAALAVVPLVAQAPPEQHTFMLTWQGTQIGSNPFTLAYYLLSFDSQPAYGEGEVSRLYSDGATSYDFNFPIVSLTDCHVISGSSSTVYTSETRRTTTVMTGFSCTDSASNEWDVGIARATNQYRSWCRFKYCWNSFPQGQQPATTGAVEQVIAP